MDTNLAKKVKQKRRKFADENARIAWEMKQKVTELLGTYPYFEMRGRDPDTLVREEYTPITFSPENQKRGWYTVFFSGLSISTEDEDVLLVPAHTLDILEQLEVKYEVVEE